MMEKHTEEVFESDLIGFGKLEGCGSYELCNGRNERRGSYV